MSRSCNGLFTVSLCCLSSWVYGQGTVVFVDAGAVGSNDGSSWTSAFSDLQAALTAAGQDKSIVAEIWVAAGIYTPTVSGGSRDASFHLLDGVRLLGGFAGGETHLDQRNPRINLTYLSGDLDGNDDELSGESNCCGARSGRGCDDAECEAAVCAEDPFCCNDIWDRTCARRTVCICGNLCSTTCDNSYHVVDGSGRGPSAVIDGFIITAGHADGEETDTLRGAGMLIDSGSPTVVDCVLLDNRAEAVGGGLYLKGDARIFNCAFLGNSAESGGGVFVEGGRGVFVNTLFSGNTALDSGGAISNNLPAEPRIVNCSISGNAAITTGGIRNSAGSRPVIANCVLWGNVDAQGRLEISQIRSDAFGLASVNYCDIQGLTGSLGGMGNIGSDPLLIDPDGADDVFGTRDDDLRIGEGSPCIDAGRNPAVPADLGDLDGDGDRKELTPVDFDRRARFFEDSHVPNTGSGSPPIVDMGAFEVASDCNGNGVMDDKDVANQTSLDCNANMIPDECEINAEGGAPGGPFYCLLDCDPDCDTNGVPDSCQPDSDHDDVINPCDLCVETPIGSPVDENGCTLHGACCFSVGVCLPNLSDQNCGLIDGNFLGFGLGCSSDPDHDGVTGCADHCPLDPLKSDPGICGCGVTDIDSDGDGVENCLDPCPRDNPDDPDGDGQCTSDDPCPRDRLDDRDRDGVCDSDDLCPDDNPDDTDGDGVCNSADGCPDDPKKSMPGFCGCGVADVDGDSDGILDCVDECLGTPPGMPVNDAGCTAIGACCFVIGVCVPDVFSGDCRLINGRYQGDQSLCDVGCATLGDLDRDLDVDLSDHGLLLECFLGPNAISDPNCDLGDFNADEHIDLLDVAGFQNGFAIP
ncbi:MAG: right-handed parallel beta-helix repeat-containing protein [Planctomycetota bacterium]